MTGNLQTDEVLRQYLLGQLSEPDRESVERQFVDDEEYFDRLLAVEDDLFDEYVSGELSPEENTLFEQNLLATPKQRQKLQQARYLQQAMQARGQSPLPMGEKFFLPQGSWRGFFKSSRIPVWAGALALLLLLALGIWFVIRERQKSEQQRAHLPQNEQSSPPINSDNSLRPTPSPFVSPRTVLALNDGGGEVVIDETGNISGLNELSPAATKAVKDALTTQRLNIAPALEGVRLRTGTLMGTPTEGVPFVLDDPVGTVVRTDRPTFVWRPLNGATSYAVTVYDISFKEMAKSGAQTALTWRVSKPLPRGQIYVWKVDASRNGETVTSPVSPAPEARFRILSQDQENVIANAEKRHRNSHLVLGVLYAEAGLLKDAQREFRLLVKANPGSELARNLLRQVSK